MVRRTALTVGLVSACLWGLLLVARADSAQRGGVAPPRGYQPVAPASSLLRAQAHHLDRIHALVASDDSADRFSALRDEAHLLAELFNISAHRAATDRARAQAIQARNLALALAQAATREDHAEVQLRADEFLATHPSRHDIER